MQGQSYTGSGHGGELDERQTMRTASNNTTVLVGQSFSCFWCGCPMTLMWQQGQGQLWACNKDGCLVVIPELRVDGQIRLGPPESIRLAPE